MTAQNDFNRRSIRLKDYDYSQAGAYFVTICTYNRDMLFGEIRNAKMVINQFGEIVTNSWLWLFERYDYIAPDYYIVMPNHFHGIIIMKDESGDSRVAPTKIPINRKPLGQLIGAFKTTSTKTINRYDKSHQGIIWQRNYYEHIIRGEKELSAVRKYILENPLSWEYDIENPNAIPNPDYEKPPWDSKESP